MGKSLMPDCKNCGCETISGQRYCEHCGTILALYPMSIIIDGIEYKLQSAEKKGNEIFFTTLWPDNATSALERTYGADNPNAFVIINGVEYALTSITSTKAEHSRLYYQALTKGHYKWIVATEWEPGKLLIEK